MPRLTVGCVLFLFLSAPALWADSVEDNYTGPAPNARAIKPPANGKTEKRGKSGGVGSGAASPVASGARVRPFESVSREREMGSWVP